MKKAKKLFKKDQRKIDEAINDKYLFFRSCTEADLLKIEKFSLMTKTEFAANKTIPKIVKEVGGRQRGSYLLALQSVLKRKDFKFSSTQIKKLIESQKNKIEKEPKLTKGQALFIVMRIQYPELTKMLIDTEYDCFDDDNKIDALINYLQRKD